MRGPVLVALQFCDRQLINQFDVRVRSVILKRTPSPNEFDRRSSSRHVPHRRSMLHTVVTFVEHCLQVFGSILLGDGQYPSV